MATIDWIKPDQLLEWDAFVARHPLGLVYHLAEWQSVLETAFRHIRGSFLVLRDEDGAIQAGLPLYHVRSWLLKNRTVSVPFATICDPLVSTQEELRMLWRAVEETGRRHKSKRVEIRGWHVNADCICSPLAAGARYKHHLLPLDRSSDELYRSFHNSCVRRRVTRAERSGMVVEERPDEEGLRMLYPMLVATRRRNGLPPMPFAFFAAMHRHLVPKYATIYLARHEGQPIGGALVLKFKGLWMDEYSGHLDSAAAGADQFLAWHVIQTAQKNGAAYFSFGRTAVDDENLLQYKRRWATVEEELTDYVWQPGAAPAPLAQPKRAVPGRLYSAAHLLRYAPGAVQKAFGDFCYRHLG